MSHAMNSSTLPTSHPPEHHHPSTTASGHGHDMMMMDIGNSIGRQHCRHSAGGDQKTHRCNPYLYHPNEVQVGKGKCPVAQLLRAWGAKEELHGDIPNP